MKKGLLMTALITGTLMCASTGAFAEELQEYTLDQMVVTATRTEARELEVPAAVTIFPFSGRFFKNLISLVYITKIILADSNCIAFTGTE